MLSRPEHYYVFCERSLGRLASVTQAYDWTQTSPTIWTTNFTYQPNGWVTQQTTPKLNDRTSQTTDNGTQQTTNYTYPERAVAVA